MADDGFSRREFIKNVSATVTTFTLSQPTLESLVLPQERTISAQEAIDDQKNLTGARQLYIDHAGNWVMSRTAETVPRKKGYWIDKLVYDHEAAKGKETAIADAQKLLKNPVAVAQYAEDYFRHLDIVDKESAERKKQEFKAGNYKDFENYVMLDLLRNMVWHGFLVDTPINSIGAKKRLSAYLFKTIFSEMYMGHKIPGVDLPSTIEPSEDTIRLHLANAIYSSFVAYNGADFGNGLVISPNNANEVKPAVTNIIIDGSALVKTSEFARQYLGKQAADVALTELANFWLHSTPFIESRETSSRFTQYERRLLRANYDNMLKAFRAQALEIKEIR